jgi:hypothetical protein
MFWPRLGFKRHYFLFWIGFWIVKNSDLKIPYIGGKSAEKVSRIILMAPKYRKAANST